MSPVLIRKHKRADKQRQEALAYVKQQTELAKYLNNQESDPTIFEKQIGQSFTSLEFDARLKRLNADLLSEEHPINRTKRCLYWLNSTGKHFICTYENGFLPEHSVFAKHAEEVWDQDFIKTKVIGGIPMAYIDKADIPKSEFVPGRGFVYDSDVAPGFKKVEMPWNESIRGWRTVLAYIVAHFAATPAQVELIFGSSNTPMWKRRLGKGQVTEIW